MAPHREGAGAGGIAGDHPAGRFDRWTVEAGDERSRGIAGIAQRNQDRDLMQRGVVQHRGIRVVGFDYQRAGRRGIGPFRPAIGEMQADIRGTGFTQ